MPTFFIESEFVSPQTIRITDPLLRHLRDSLRLDRGDELTVTDRAGVRYRTEIVEVTATALEARILDKATAPQRTSPTVVLAQALLKGEKMDWVIQKATELGIDRLVPVQTKHSVIKIQPERLDHQRTRWERIALEAAQQSERWTLPTIEVPRDLTSLFQQQAAAAAKVILAERSRNVPLMTVRLPTDPEQTVVMLIGPEGGWDQEELREAADAGFQAVTIGTRILRAETAAIAAISIVQSRLGELG